MKIKWKRYKWAGISSTLKTYISDCSIGSTKKLYSIGEPNKNLMLFNEGQFRLYVDTKKGGQEIVVYHGKHGHDIYHEQFTSKLNILKIFKHAEKAIILSML